MGERSVVELMVLMLTATVCVSILLSGAAIVVVEVTNPDTDTALLTTGLTNILGVLLGAVLGLLAGRTERGKDLHQRPGGREDDL